MYIQRRMSGIGFSGMRGGRLPGRSTRRRRGFSWIAAGAAAALVCALLIWIAVQIHGQGRPVFSAENSFPRNIVDMHGTHAADIYALPGLRC
jgi:hypothetical protein